MGGMKTVVMLKHRFFVAKVAAVRKIFDEKFTAFSQKAVTKTNLEVLT